MAVTYQGHIVILLAIFPVAVIKISLKKQLYGQKGFFGILFQKEAVCHGEYKLSR